MVCTTCPGTLFPAQLEAFFPQQNGDNINRLCNKRREYAICPFVAVPLSSTEFPIAWTPFLIQVGLFQAPDGPLGYESFKCLLCSCFGLGLAEETA